MRRGAGLALPQDDVVYFDFSPLNILVDGARIVCIRDDGPVDERDTLKWCAGSPRKLA